jgi:GH24 family phage-related lysozyme (muramidase)
MACCGVGEIIADEEKQARWRERRGGGCRPSQGKRREREKERGKVGNSGS